VICPSFTVFIRTTTATRNNLRNAKRAKPSKVLLGHLVVSAPGDNALHADPFLFVLLMPNKKMQAEALRAPLIGGATRPADRGRWVSFAAIEATDDDPLRCVDHQARRWHAVV
jgi:hypothetical protein